MKCPVTIYIELSELYALAEMMRKEGVAKINTSQVVGYALRTMAQVAKTRGVMELEEKETLDRLDLMGLLPKNIAQTLGRTRRIDEVNRSGYAAMEVLTQMQAGSSKALPPLVAVEPASQTKAIVPERISTLYAQYLQFVDDFDPVREKTYKETMHAFLLQHKPDQTLWNEFVQWAIDTFPVVRMELKGE